MFRLWAKIFQNNHMLKDICIEDGSDDTRTHKVFHSLDEVCHQFDLGTPIWLDLTFLISNGITRPVLPRTVLWNLLISTIWKYR